jgi:tellurite resistance protein TerC
MVIDLKFVHGTARVPSIREVALWCGFCVFLALLFNLGIYLFMGSEKALQFLTGYLIEESLSVDNLFVFVLIFKYFGVPEIYQPRVLHWGILGAIVMRFVFIFAGAALLEAFHWVIYIFGAALIYTGIKMMFEEEKKLEPEKNLALRFFKKVMPVADRGFVDDRFVVRMNGALYATPLLIVLVLIESSDLVFAVDSIPAIFAITRDTFIVYTSNIFAVLGLRAMYFLLSGIIPLFAYLKAGISVVLCFVGVKMVLADVFKIPTLFSLAVVVAILGGSILLSVLKNKSKEKTR